MNKPVALIVLLLGIGFSPGDCHADSAADQAAIRAEWVAWLKVCTAGDADGYLGFLTDDAVIADLAEGKTPYIGRSAIQPFIRDFFAQYTFSWTEVSQEIVVTGDVAIRRYTGTASFTPRAGGETKHYPRHYIDVLQRGKDGRWRVSQHIFIDKVMARRT